MIELNLYRQIRKKRDKLIDCNVYINFNPQEDVI